MKIDPITLEILNTRVAAAADEMAVTLKRTGRSLYVQESVDFAVGLVSSDGRMFGTAREYGTAMLDYDCLPTIKAVADVEGLEDGDIILTNHPYLSAGLVTHTPDLTLLKPYFVDGEPVCFGYSFVHSTDVGGNVPSSISPSNAELFQEGLLIPPIKLVRKGELNQDVVSLYRANARTPDMNMQDLTAMLTALDIGSDRVADLIDTYGKEVFLQAQSDLFDYARQKARAVLRRIPDGEYDFWDFMDDDAVTPVPVRIRVKVTVDDGKLHIDFTGTDPQVMSSYNVPTGGARHPWFTLRIMHYVTTHDPSVPLNAGIFADVSVKAPKGTILNPEYPGAVGVRAATAYRCNDAVTGALSSAGPEDMPAPSGGAMVPVVLAEYDRLTGQPNVVVLNPVIVGSGARYGSDGYDGIDGSISSIRNTPIERSELEVGVEILKYGLRRDSAGPGHWRGGLGLVFGFRTTQAGSRVLARGLERFRFRPWGMAGGGCGATMRVILNEGTDAEQSLGKISIIDLAEGDTVTFMTPGGGGYGDPILRDPHAVLSDVLSGFVSVDAAEQDYGVVVNGDRVDQSATEELRHDRPPRRPNLSSYDFGPERDAWDQVFTDDLMFRLNSALLELPLYARQARRQEIFHRVVPNLHDPDSIAANDLITEPQMQNASLAAEIDALVSEIGNRANA